MKSPCTRVLTAALLTAALTGCAGATASTPQGPTPVQPGAPGEASGVADVGAVRRAEMAHTAADVAFIQGMLAHHAQALVMTDLVPERTQRREIQLLAQRIDVSQRDEIAQMHRWLRDHGQPVPAAGMDHAAHGAAGHAGHQAAGGEHALMPGMLTEAELARLAAARGTDFDRLFLQYMIRHHLGAVTMVEELFRQPGAGQQGDIYQIAEAVASDQKIEIDRMQQLLAAIG